jgi:hypothetical protein
VARIISRKQRRGVDVEREQIADALAYSTRFMRWSGVRPGLGCATAIRSIAVSMAPAKPSSIARSGRRAPAGGMRPARTLRTTFSQVSGSAPARSGDSPWSDRLPVFSVSLWQVTQ